MNRHAVYFLKRKSGSNQHHLCYYLSHHVSLPYIMPLTSLTLCFIMSHLTHDLSHNILLCHISHHASSGLIGFPMFFFPHVPDSSHLMSLIITCLKRFSELQYMSHMLHHISHQVSSCLIDWLNIMSYRCHVSLSVPLIICLVLSPVSLHVS